jgi:sterol desaturase/sphingolipid hydroxylase (fatty acid hydroxylase superfamily)
MDLLALIYAATLRGYAAWGIIFAVLTVLEFVFPQGERTLAGRARTLLFWAAWIPASAAIPMLLLRCWQWLHLHPLLAIPLIQSLALPALAVAVVGTVASMLVSDFMAYWHHRIQHRFLWRFHAVHHSIRDMNAVNSYHHISETLFSTLIITLPMTLIVVDCGPVVAWVPILTWYQVVYLHSPTRLNFGPLRAIFTDNRYHRIHHSVEQRHFDTNFGISLSIWDRMFGTHHAVARGEWPLVGLDEMPPPTTLREWIDLPARYRATPQPEGALVARPA